MKKLEILNKYEDALNLLDQYDHQEVEEIKGNPSTSTLNYQDFKFDIKKMNARDIINSMKFNDTSSVFGVEKEEGKLNGILEAIEQTAFGQEVYSSLEEKASNLLYFLVKDHPFVDGCKRIAASLFIIYLHKNNSLYISNGTLVSLVLLIAESKPEEKDIMIKVIMSILFKKL